MASQGLRTKLTRIRTRAEAGVRMSLDGTPELRVSDPACHIQPDYLEITYCFGPGQNRGWWVASEIRAQGYLVLTPGPDCCQRLGLERHTRVWGDGCIGDVQSDWDLPGWLDTLVSELRPSGQISLPGGDR